MSSEILNSLLLIEEDIQHVEGDYTLSFLIDPKNEIFNGHFPQQPVLPGVVMIDLVRKALQKIEGKPYKMVSSGNIKFLKLLVPNERLYTLKLKIKSEEDKKIIAAQIIQDELIYFKQNSTYIGK